MFRSVLRMKPCLSSVFNFRIAGETKNEFLSVLLKNCVTFLFGFKYTQFVIHLFIGKFGITIVMFQIFLKTFF